MLDSSFSSHRAVWVEITSSEHDHGGEGWKFGTCLWSPTRDSAGGHAYRVMTFLEAGDLVLHFYKHGWDNRRPSRRLCAQSLVESPAREVHEEPPSPGPWKDMAPFYRIDLTDFHWLEEPLDLGEFSDIYADEILHEKNTDEPKYYPFQRYGNDTRVATGTYLARCTENLYGLLQEALEIEAAADDPAERESSHKEFAESRRKMRETSYFARNSRLVKAAKEHYGYQCKGCGFDFEAAYGELGEKYIECHHLVPLAEREDLEAGEATETSLDEVTVLCSNCHRMVHRGERPTLPVEELRERLQVEFEPAVKSWESQKN